MPKWFGMTIHYLTFKKVLTSRQGWTFTWGGPRKTEKMLMLSAPPEECCSCKTAKKLYRDNIRRDGLERSRQRRKESTRLASGAIFVNGSEVCIVVDEKVHQEVNDG
jgi:hypothetical protein